MLGAPLATLAGGGARAQTSQGAGAPADALLLRRFDEVLKVLREPRSSRAETAASTGLGTLRALDPISLSPEGQLRLAAVLQGLQTEAALEQLFPFGSAGGAPYAVHPRGGAHLRVRAALEAPETAGSERTLSELAREVNRETDQIKSDAERGVILPGFLLEQTLSALAGAARAGRRSSTAGGVASALSRQGEVLEVLRPRAPSEPGVWRFANGQSYYALALGLNAGGRTDPDEAHQRGLTAVRRLQAEVDTLLRSAGYRRGAVAERLRALTGDPQHLYPATEAGKAQAVADMTAALHRVQARLPAAFARLPAASVEVRRMSAAEEAAGRPGRREPGGYVVDLIRIRNRPSWTLPSVVHHELHPGHLFQEALVERPPHPLQLRYAPGYGEGWAVYAEQLADELGAYGDDPLGRIGYLQWMLFRMGRLVVDTGIHARRWSRKRAIAELREIQGGPIAFITIEEDVDRMVM
ncbi:MAG: DUF885 domain-containing protein, partial [Proteobacteria bacterium]|nr:DUF885 domain-containing protein [Pseudomonadota bacterium]